MICRNHPQVLFLPGRKSAAAGDVGAGSAMPRRVDNSREPAPGTAAA